mgnify:FL=1
MKTRKTLNALSLVTQLVNLCYNLSADRQGFKTSQNYHNFGLVALVALVVLLSACVPSLNPLYTDEDLIFNPELLGTWGEPDEKESWTFEQKGEKEYKLTHSDKQGEATFSVHLLKIGNTTFLDIYPDAAEPINSLYQMHLFPVHTFYKVVIEKGEVALQMFGSSSLEDAIKAGEIDLDYVMQDGSLLLTASTETLQKVVLEHVDNEKIFQDPTRLTKRD